MKMNTENSTAINDTQLAFSGTFEGYSFDVIVSRISSSTPTEQWWPLISYTDSSGVMVERLTRVEKGPFSTPEAAQAAGKEEVAKRIMKDKMSKSAD